VTQKTYPIKIFRICVTFKYLIVLGSINLTTGDSMKLFYFSKKLTGTAIISIIGISFMFYAYSTGITGVTLKNGDGCTCHGPTPFENVFVQINGPDTLVYNQSASYTVTVSGGPLSAAGTNIAASTGLLTTAGTGLQKIGDELTHTSPKSPSSGVVTFSFNYTAPSVTSTITLYANGNSVNLSGGNEGDQWNFASNKTVVVLPFIPVELSSFLALIDRNNVNLTWTTASEKNNSGFEILRSSGSQDYISLGFIKGKGSSTETNNYSFSDNSLMPGNYSYKLRQIDFNGTSTDYKLSSEVEINAPENFALFQNYPNPFNPSTTIEFELDTEQNVSLKIFNALGEELAQLFNGTLPAGKHKREFNTAYIKNLSSGIYFYELKGEKSHQVRKMILNK
jgi:hypothetical protein